MKISLNWLKEYVDIPKNITPQKLGELLTLHSVEVEEVIEQAKGLDGIVVGQILEIKKHLNADKLKLVNVDIGKNKPIQVVCGGTNLKEKMLVAFAKIGSYVRWHGQGELITLEKVKIRGEVSEGMICASCEIGLGEYKEGDSTVYEVESRKHALSQAEVSKVQSHELIGLSLAEVLGLDDVVIDIDNKTITHRPDLWGHYGIAREVAAILDLKLKKRNSATELHSSAETMEPAGVAVIIGSKFQITNSKLVLSQVEGLQKNPKSQIPKSNIDLKIEIKDSKLCPRYMGVVVDNIKIEPSPKWMQTRLSAVGVRPINNIVDITNYVMLDLGQPLHAFDFNKLSFAHMGSGQPLLDRRDTASSGWPLPKLKFLNDKLAGVKIIVRRAANGEKITTLDNVERKLDDEMLVIADEKKPIAIAGVMGGINSEVDDKTTKIIIESANFEPINNRQTSTKLGLRTEAVARYEKSLDPNLCEAAMSRVLDLVAEIIPESKAVSKIADQKKFKLNQGPIALSVNYVQRKIGVEIGAGEIKSILDRLGFLVVATTTPTTPPTPPNRGGTTSRPPLLGGVGGVVGWADTVFQVKIPTWRATKDISMADDLIEEIARIYGFDNIKAKMPLVEMIPPEVNQTRKFERKLKDILTSLSFDEVANYAFVSEDMVKKFGRQPDEYIKLSNSLSKDYAILRQSLLENLVINIRDNLRYFDNFKIFEFGSTFKKQPGRYLAHPDKANKLPKQEKFISGVVVDIDKKIDEIFFQAKEAVENLLIKAGVKDYEILPVKNSGVQADIFVNKQKIGFIGIIGKKIQNNFDINPKANCGIFELSFDKLFAVPKTEIQHQTLAKFPEVKIDLAVIAPKKILWYNIEEEIRKIAGNQLKKIELFDVYEGEGIIADKKSLAMHLSFGENERTMEMGEVECLRERIVGGLGKKWEVDIRG